MENEQQINQQPTINEEIEESKKNQIEEQQDLGLHTITQAFKQEINSSTTMFHRGSLRSGQRIEYSGSIVIIGDVNAGAEVIAGENIAILGDLRGLAHAGAKGNMKAIITANLIQCPQIRIANVIKENEIKTIEIEQKEQIYTYAYVNEEDEIVLE